MISAMQAKKLLTKGCWGFLASATILSSDQKKKPEDVQIVKDFVDVFPEDLPGLAPEREISFEIELMPGTGPISKVPYCMEPAELKELQTQLQEFLDSEFIRPSHSLGGTPILFV